MPRTWKHTARTPKRIVRVSAGIQALHAPRKNLPQTGKIFRQNPSLHKLMKLL
jgi:hypothetical protein